jgi:hypothetical protein
MTIPVPEPTPDPVTLGEVFDATCEVANVLDPTIPDFATAGTNVGISQAIDLAAQNINANPNPTPLYGLAWLGINGLKFIKDNVAAGYNFICQQVKQEGPHYEFTTHIRDGWQKLNPVQKVLVVGFIAVIALAAIAIILPIP